MPTYDYRCKECEHEHEVFHKMDKKPRIKCPECGASCKKLIGAGTRPIFKGEGFYETDYRKPDRKNKSIEKAIKDNAPDDQLRKGGVKREDL